MAQIVLINTSTADRGLVLGHHTRTDCIFLLLLTKLSERTSFVTKSNFGEVVSAGLSISGELLDFSKLQNYENLMAG